MSLKTLTFQTELPYPIEEVFTWHMRSGACDRLIPPWEKIRIIKHPQTVINEADVYLRYDLSGFLNLKCPYFNWHLKHADLVHNKSFTDLQIKGPFKAYRHRHLFSGDHKRTVLNDQIDYELPLSSISHRISKNLIDKQLARTFYYRDCILKNDLGFHSGFSSKRKLNFLISGATGMIGKALCAFLTTGGHKVSRITRSKSDLKPGDLYFDGKKIEINPEAEFDCVINLAGAGIADKRWSDAYKKELYESRVSFTEILLKALKSLHKTPEKLISASALGFYTDNGQASTESSPKGSGFLSDLCAAWEKTALKAKESGMQAVIIRLAPVIDPSGGTLKKMLPAFLSGFGATLGSGKQKFSWVSLDDVIRAILFLAYHESPQETFNLCSPQVIDNSEMTESLASALKRPAFIKIPPAILKIFFGQLAEEAFLSSIDCRPEALLQAGYQFLYPDFNKLLCYCLGIRHKSIEAL